MAATCSRLSSKHGIVCILIRVTSIFLTDLHSARIGTFCVRVRGVEIYLKNINGSAKSTLIVAIYRSPNSHHSLFLSKLSILFSKLNPEIKNNTIYLSGDFNIQYTFYRIAVLITFNCYDSNLFNPVPNY